MRDCLPCWRNLEQRRRGEATKGGLARLRFLSIYFAPNRPRSMAIYDLYSKRQKRLRGEVKDVYVYDSIPKELRIQILHIWHDSLGDFTDYSSALHNYGVSTVIENYSAIVDVLCREYSMFSLADLRGRQGRSYYEELRHFFLAEQDTDRVLSVIELSFFVIDKSVRENAHTYKENCDPAVVADTAINDLNARFQEHGLGYEYRSGEIIRIDSKLIHKEAVVPALSLLAEKSYEGAQEEFLKAFEHYRQGRTKETLVEALKSLESVLKVICKKRKWHYDPTANCSKLIEICFTNGLIPAFWQSHFNSLRNSLESGVPTARNKQAGHGQGDEIKDVPSYIASYVLHLTASAIVFVVEAEKAL